MKYEKKYERAFNLNELGFINFPLKISSVKISRILNGRRMGCPHCFPHGPETINSTRYDNFQRNWKKYRKRQWKSE